MKTHKQEVFFFATQSQDIEIAKRVYVTEYKQDNIYLLSPDYLQITMHTNDVTRTQILTSPVTCRSKENLAGAKSLYHPVAILDPFSCRLCRSCDWSFWWTTSLDLNTQGRQPGLHRWASVRRADIRQTCFFFNTCTWLVPRLSLSHSRHLPHAPDTWNHFACGGISAQVLKDTADQFVRLGLDKLNYQLVPANRSCPLLCPFQPALINVITACYCKIYTCLILTCNSHCPWHDVVYLC